MNRIVTGLQGPALDLDPADVHFPTVDGERPSQDHEWCEVDLDGERRRIRFHDYAEIFDVPGLYELIFHERLQCESPHAVVGLLAQELRTARVDTAGLRALDVGAGNGMVGEELTAAGVGCIVGVDIIPEAAEAATRDRPGVYEDYVVCDLTDLDGGDRDRLEDEPFACMTTVAALGFDDIPPRAFAQAFNLVQDGGWIAFNIKEDFFDGDDQTGFRRLIARMVEDGLIEERARRRYRHRLSVGGEPLRYVAMVGVKQGTVPEAWVPND